MTIRKILIGGFIIGTLDIICAILQTLIKGRDPVMMLKFIASGFFGPEVFARDNVYALYGILFHYVIATIWTALFFTAYTRTLIYRINRWVLATGYALVVWGVMNFVVLPLSNTPDIKYDLAAMIVSLAILFLAVGFPLVFLAGWFFKHRKRTWEN